MTKQHTRNINVKPKGKKKEKEEKKKQLRFGVEASTPFYLYNLLYFRVS